MTMQDMTVSHDHDEGMPGILVAFVLCGISGFIVGVTSSYLLF